MECRENSYAMLENAEEWIEGVGGDILLGTLGNGQGDVWVWFRRRDDPVGTPIAS